MYREETIEELKEKVKQLKSTEEICRVLCDMLDEGVSEEEIGELVREIHPEEIEEESLLQK